ncbi:MULTISPECIES: alanine racemase [Thermoactinomyces]|jgi:alanine racemase|uniref:Alanine racemase n=1 Tax=Thermoactinomyces daqus TaxID=1329516 RepID=A0A7W1XCI6_9BACL|nr:MULTISPECIES: alanine racemase [Thermoactinomyces]MBA4544135.1 alanine racemase [Thermoactinomyces daqus]MBH8599523.1 alanine racemase [Thermoactinomyces sp. CICC 10523]MBH8605442.1 alanine racemase [Thermoactinomyces sp. CICC 10522]MBH8608964.1 alanine racemase [Thermoactinomyces sp. CICC 10521]
METKIGRDTVVVVDLDAIAHNVREFRRHLGPDVKIMAVVKANAYGHGAVQVAKTALEAGAEYLAVAFEDEGIELRRAGIEAPVLVLGLTPDHAVAEALKAGLTLTVYHHESLQTIEREAARLGIRARVHVKLDTGMGRLGLFPDEAVAFVKRALELKSVEVEGIFTHYATSDQADKEYALYQERRFAEVLNRLEKEGISIPLPHIANSGGAIDLSDHAYRMARVGISLYGYYPSDQVNRTAVNLRPALTLKTRIADLKQPPAGTGVSYGKTYISDGDEWIAAVPVGYADGVNRHLSNRGFALVRGRRVPIVGRVCMDQLMLNVTNAMPVEIGDEVVLYGEQYGECITVDEVAKLLGTISYEVVSTLSHRIPRVYRKEGEVVEIVNRLRF